MAVVQKIDLNRALFDPAAVFRRPAAVVEDESLPLEDKVEILHRWTYDAIEMAVAEEEGMGGGEIVSVDAILAALSCLTDGYRSKQTGPTKHATA